MSEVLLEALERDEKGNKVRKNGFVPGIIYGSGEKENKSVKFQADKLDTCLRKLSGKKVKVKLGEEIQTGFIKETQRAPITGKLMHIDIQVAGSEDMVRMKLPVIFEGREKLELKGLMLDVHASQVTLHGMEKDLPEKLTIDIGDKNAGDIITASMLKLGAGLKLVGDPDEILAIINEPQIEEEETEPKTESTNANATDASATDAQAPESQN